MYIKKRISKILLRVLFFFMLFNLSGLSYLLIKNRYRPVILSYLGCAEGKKNGGFFKKESYSEFEYLYCNAGYWVGDTLEELIEWNVDKPEEVEFEVNTRKDMMYICSWHVPLKSFEYAPGCHPIGGGNYNRATFFRDQYQEGVCFFYEAADINPGSMVLESECQLMYLPDRTEEIIMCILLFLLVGTLETGYLCYHKK